MKKVPDVFVVAERKAKQQMHRLAHAARFRFQRYMKIAEKADTTEKRKRAERTAYQAIALAQQGITKMEKTLAQLRKSVEKHRRR